MGRCRFASAAGVTSCVAKSLSHHCTGPTGMPDRSAKYERAVVMLLRDPPRAQAQHIDAVCYRLPCSHGLPVFAPDSCKRLAHVGVRTRRVAKRAVEDRFHSKAPSVLFECISEL